MEMEGWLSLCFVATSTLLAALLCRLSRQISAGGKTKNKKRQLPPGPWTLPIIGSLHHVFGVLPHRTMAQLSRRHGPLMLLRLGEIPTVVVSSAEAAELVMKTNDLMFVSRPRSTMQTIFGCGGKSISFAPYGDRWRQMRKICITELLSSKQVRRMEGIRAEEVGNLLRSIAAAASSPAGGTVNVREMVTALSNDVVTRAVFGGKFTQQREFLREMDEAFQLLGGFSLVDLFPSSWLVRRLSNGERHMRRCHGRIQQIIAGVIHKRKAAGEDGCGSDSDEEDLLDVLLRLQREDSLEFPLTTEVIGAVLFDMFAGATNTTATILEWCMSELVINPGAMAKAQMEVREMIGHGRAVVTNSDLPELCYMRMVIKEVLRLHPPAALIPRLTREDCTVMGYDMLKDTNVFINIFAVSRDPRYWENPEDFNPERFENNDMSYNGTRFEFTPFGAGRRQCPGIMFGTSTLDVTLANLLYHFDWMLPDGASPASFDMSERFGLTISRKHGLQLKAIPHTCV
uniref:Uncharacterized protein n=1 Tax=Avena sativa TaxID=4498 RepID=A0ACD5ZNR2_AVESA